MRNLRAEALATASVYLDAYKELLSVPGVTPYAMPFQLNMAVGPLRLRVLVLGEDEPGPEELRDVALNSPPALHLAHEAMKMSPPPTLPVALEPRLKQLIRYLAEADTAMVAYRDSV
jgi:hypothetical protein